MSAPSPGSPTFRLVVGEVEARNTTSRLVIPTASEGIWAPFERVGETLATKSHPFAPHAHERQEVLTYILEGFATYQLGAAPPESLAAGALRFLTSPDKVSHRISPAKASPIRWFNLVVGLRPGLGLSTRLQSGRHGSVAGGGRAISTVPLVGPGSDIRSEGGLECSDLRFPEGGSTFSRIGHARRGVVYALAGEGVVDHRTLRAGEAVLVEGAAGIAIQGSPGFRAIVSSAPTSAPVG